MKEYDGNKTLLPLIPEGSPYRGTRPILVEIIKNLPSGPKALVVNYKKEDMIEATIKKVATLEEANYLIWAAHNLERMADRVTNICEKVSFVITGDMIELEDPD